MDYMEHGLSGHLVVWLVEKDCKSAYVCAMFLHQLMVEKIASERDDKK